MRLAHAETNEWGITRRYYIDEMTGEITVSEGQDVEPLLDRNKRMANDNGKTITSEVANPIASIPAATILKWFREEGWWLYDADKDPDVQKKLQQKLNCSDWRAIRTSELHV